jgi:hypothetical protein
MIDTVGQQARTERLGNKGRPPTHVVTIKGRGNMMSAGSAEAPRRRVARLE